MSEFILIFKSPRLTIDNRNLRHRIFFFLVGGKLVIQFEVRTIYFNIIINYCLFQKVKLLISEL